ncbi:hypothetical protein [Archangium lansingense]|uniref:DNA topoisomerase (ATP-hydrolyzing) n=1 Tax=Archangium lansingense TaxID=2995310 RepID=A0ABT3ZXB9_9BACT|nr:hypothetical protein [Archangium lansinium]MCY1074043.1 hypothetical protein [Archangium lansinium]
MSWRGGRFWPVSEYSQDDVVVLDAVTAVRKRPGMYLGDTGVRGLSRLVDFLLHAAMAEDRGGHLQQLHLSLGEDGSLELLEDGQPLPPESLPDILTEMRPGGRPGTVAPPYASLRAEAVCVFALSEQYELEAWEDARRWHLKGQAGVIHEHPTPEPLQGTRLPGPRGTRIKLTPDLTLFEPGITFDARRLHLRCRELAGLRPGLRIHFRSARLEEWIQYPRGLADLVDELTLYTLPRMATPLVVEARWEDFRVRCALQWTAGEDCQVWSFVNTVRTRRGGSHVQGVLDALGAAMARLRRHKKPWPRERFLPGLTLIVAMDSPAYHCEWWYSQQFLFRTEWGLRDGVASVLTPVLVEALRNINGHPGQSTR